MRSTSCTISTIAVLTGAGTPAGARGVDHRAVEEVDLRELPAADALQRRPRIRHRPHPPRQQPRERRPCPQRQHADQLEHPPGHALHRPESHAGRAGDAHRLPHARGHHPPQPVVGDDVLHAHPGDRGQRVDVVDEQLRPLRALDVVGHLHRKRASQHARHAIQHLPRRRRRSADHERILARDEHVARPDVGGGEQREPAEHGGGGGVLRRDGESAESVLHDEERNPVERGRTGVECRRGILGLGRQDGDVGHSCRSVKPLDLSRRTRPTRPRAGCRRAGSPSRFSPRAVTSTSCPARARRAASVPPTAPAPSTAMRMCSSSTSYASTSSRSGCSIEPVSAGRPRPAGRNSDTIAVAASTAPPTATAGMAAST